MQLPRSVRIVAFPAFIAAVLFGAWYFREPLTAVFRTPEALGAWIDERREIGAAIYVLVQTFQVAVFIVPGEVVQIAGGYLFGVWLGTLLSVLGIGIGSSINFVVGRLFGEPFVRTVLGPRRMARLEHVSHSPRARLGFFLLFVIPGLPKDVLCYFGGIAPFRFATFLALSMAGRLPAIVGSTVMGGAAREESWLVSGALLVLAIVFLVVGLRYHERLTDLIERWSSRGGGDRRESDGR
jgi:uncharacterized membrane protein YdjX (TVP38/TMEM64 family)